MKKIKKLKKVIASLIKRIEMLENKDKPLVPSKEIQEKNIEESFKNIDIKDE